MYNSTKLEVLFCDSHFSSFENLIPTRVLPFTEVYQYSTSALWFNCLRFSAFASKNLFKLKLEPLPKNTAQLNRLKLSDKNSLACVELSQKDSTWGGKARPSSSILPAMSHTLPTSCFFKDARVKVRPQINVMTGVTDEAKTQGSKGERGDRWREMGADEPEGEEEEREKDKNVIKNTHEGTY